MNPNQRAESFAITDPVDVAVIVVTYNSSHHIDALIESLRHELVDVTLRVIVADNRSSDESLKRARAHPDVIAFSTGGNLGYSAGINMAMEHLGNAEAILILNPDLQVGRGTIHALLHLLKSNSSIGMVAPAVVDDNGLRAYSIFNEPSVVRALSDAVLGRVWKTRPAAISEWVRHPRAYDEPGPIDWATGAAMLIRRSTALRVGEWDERFFLYSEETDYCRRVRDCGQQVWFEPHAVVRHSQGGSSTSQSLHALLAVNRLRYVAKHAPNSVGLYRVAVILATLLRRKQHAVLREVLRYQPDRPVGDSLPKGDWAGAPEQARPSASVVIPAHNEGAVIGRTLAALAAPLSNEALELIVASNGSTDDTTEQASQFAGVHILQLSAASKVAALNAADEVATCWPRIYLDADIQLPATAIPSLVRALDQPGVLAARPPFQYDTTGASRTVRAYYRARGRISSLSNALWGAGVYALNEAGHARFGEFPPLTADDLYVDQLFTAEEKAIPLTAPVIVTTPRTIRGLMKILTRSRRGASTQGVDTGLETLRSLASSIRGPISLWDSAVFVLLTLAARNQVRSSDTPAGTWERDESSRTKVKTSERRAI